MLSAAITYLASVVIIAYALCALNGMTRRGCNLFRTAHVLMAVGAFGTIAEPIFGGLSAARWPGAAMAFGIALFLVARDRDARVRSKALDAWRRGGVRARS